MLENFELLDCLWIGSKNREESVEFVAPLNQAVKELGTLITTTLVVRYVVIGFFVAVRNALEEYSAITATLALGTFVTILCALEQL